MHWFLAIAAPFTDQWRPVISHAVPRMAAAALLGGIIGLEREFRHKPAGLRTNMLICLGSALFTMLSDELAGSFGGDHTRIAAQIIAGIGFIGAGSILRERGSITGLTSAATIFVTASVGMAAGGGLYLTAAFATVIVLIALKVLGTVEHYFENKRLRVSYEVRGRDTEGVLKELNRIFGEENMRMENVHAARAGDMARVVFEVEGIRPGYNGLDLRLHQSSVFSNVQSLGTAEPE
jgi:putative Mg2+ transporter-C (MgtC) family protein